MSASLPLIAPMRLSSAREPFDCPGWVFELKHDGFRGLAYIENGACRLVSRNGHEFRGFKQLCEAIVRRLEVRNAIVDGEICCLGEDGRSLFNALLFRRGEPYFYAFDLLWLNGRDFRELPLLKRKEKLKRLLASAADSPILYTSHVECRGTTLFNAVCTYDLEGIVAKSENSRYQCGDERSGDWIKIKNPRYSQMRGRHELFSAR